MTEFTLTLAENGYILDYHNTRMVFEGGNEMPLRLMKELLCDVTELLDSGECEKIKISINVEKGEEDDKTTH